MVTSATEIPILVGVYVILFRNINKFSEEDGAVHKNDSEEYDYSKYMMDEYLSNEDDFNKI